MNDASNSNKMNQSNRQGVLSFSLHFSSFFPLILVLVYVRIRKAKYQLTEEKERQDQGIAEMSDLPGFLSVRVLRGVNLVSRDATGSDPYVVLHLDHQKVKTGVMKKTVNPVWNEELTLAVKDPATPIKLEVFDKDTFSKDDRMGDAEFDIEALMQIVKMDLEDIRSGTVVRTVRPGRQCCLADESNIIWENGQIVQDMLLKLRNVETGVVHLQLKWVKITDIGSSTW
ncbi:GTPase activating protein 1-like [Oryza brachyantha]|uniref:GTPase activating protein 1-like n=1 Tax=Oryza brachyantha TaxID=4533 RepID=UPI0007760BF3|nr:GTPase activating protein 1-like [Oryza brachyantha]